MIQIIKMPEWKAFERVWGRRKRSFYEEAAKLVVLDITDGIDSGTDATGRSFPALEPETIARKGRADPLINRGLLHNPNTYRRVIDVNRDRAEISIKPLKMGLRNMTTGEVVQEDKARDKVAVELQIDGIDSKRGRKFFRFFGISKDAVEGVMGLLDEIVTEALEAM